MMRERSETKKAEMEVEMARKLVPTCIACVSLPVVLSQVFLFICFVIREAIFHYLSFEEKMNGRSGLKRDFFFVFYFMEASGEMSGEVFFFS